MTSKAKLLTKARSNPRGLRFDELRALAEALGFRLERIGGSHHIFKHATAPVALNLQPDRHGRAKEY